MKLEIMKTYLYIVSTDEKNYNIYSNDLYLILKIVFLILCKVIKNIIFIYTIKCSI